nr:hypothetical protein [Mycobacterium tuberculosis]
MYTSHNFWCAAAVSAAVYVGSAVVPAAVAGPLFVGRVSATIKAAAPSTTAAIATLATAANGQLRERGGAGGWVGVHCPVVGGGGVGHPRKAIAAAVSVHSTCMPAAGTDGPPTPTAGALGGRGGETVHGGGGPGIGWLLPNAGVASDNIGALLRGSDKPGAD